MKKVIVTLSLFASLGVFLAACSKTKDLMETGDQQQTEAFKTDHSAAESKFAQEPIHFNAPFVFPEGMVYDPSTDRFLVSSIAQGMIGAVSREGVYSPFIQDADLASTAGMEIDKAQKRLLVTNSNIGGTLAQLAIYDLNTKARLFLVNLAAVANDGAPHLANDVAIDQQGNAYVTDSYAGIIYRIDRFGNASIFYQNPAFTPAPGGFGFNGIEYSNSEQGYLLVAHSALNQVLKIPVNNPSDFTTVQLNTPIISPDGLLLSKNGKELIIVNNTVQFPGSKVMSFETNDGWETGTSTGTFETGIVYPTTLTSDGKTEYVLYSYIHLLMGGQPKETFTIQPLPFASNKPF